jgi:hypothetical protein
MVVSAVAFGVAFLPVAITAAALLAAAALVRRRRAWPHRSLAIRLVLGVAVFGALVYIIEGIWLGRYGMATMHLIEVCGPVDGIRSAWHYETNSFGSLDANGFFSCGTGLDDPEPMCVAHKI